MASERANLGQAGGAHLAEVPHRPKPHRARKSTGQGGPQNGSQGEAPLEQESGRRRRRRRPSMLLRT
eukprot:2503437-Pyramimonas_sp.AAC.1